MATIQEKLAESLEVLKTFQDNHGDNLVIQGADTLGRTHTERLVNSGYLQMVIKGWYIPSMPGREGDSTVWYVSYWSFVTAYLNKKFNGAWCLSPELSLYFYSGKTVIPKQLIVRSESGSNNILQLPFGTSVVDIKATLPQKVVQEPRYGVRLYPMEYALLMVGPDYYRRNALEARTCLASMKDVSPLVSAAIDGGHTTRAGRVAGALRSIGREEMSDEILRMMRQVGYTVSEENPFEENVKMETFAESPYAARIRLMWMQMRKVVLGIVKVKPVKQDAASVLAMMDATYVKDSYNSLSIEGYKITEELLERVRSGNWNPEKDEEDKERKDALAARGYYQAYELLKQGVAGCFSGQAPAQLYAKAHQDWHFQLFEPCIRAGIVKATDLAYAFESGCRTGCHEHLVGLDDEGGQCSSESHFRAFLLCVYPSIHGWQWPNRSICNEQPVSYSGLSLGSSSHESPSGIYGSSGASERGREHRSVCTICTKLDVAYVYSYRKR